MIRIFLPLYLMLFIASFSTEKLLGDALVLFAPEAIMDDTQADLSGAFYMAEHILHNTPPDQWPAELTRMSAPNVPVQLVSESDFELSDKEIEALHNGSIIVTNLDNDIALKWFASPGKLLQIGPMRSTDLFDENLFLVSFGHSALLVICVILWSLTVQRRIRHLTNTTRQFGEGELSVRASESGGLKVSQLNHNFNTMAERIQRLIESNKLLSNAIAHELRTPISRIKFELDYAHDSNDASRLHESFNSISEDIEELEALVSEVLHFARFERQDVQLNMQPHDLNRWLQNWFNEQKITPPTITLTFTPTKNECIASFDTTAIKRALDNLVINSCRYAKSEIKVSLYSGRDTVSIVVDDNGDGIPQSHRATLFDPFVRADKSRSKQTGGFGLGLAIVKQIMQAHHGDAKVENSPLGGARFIISWPVAVSITT